MKVAADSIEELIVKSPRPGEMLAIDAFISATAPQLPRRLFSGPSITVIGYGERIWQNMSASGVWPVIAVAPQQHQISGYVAAERHGIPLVTAFGDRLGRGNGKTCLRFRRFDALDRAALAELVTEAAAAAEEQETTYGRNCAVPVEES
jgi:hypothetical protein